MPECNTLSVTRLHLVMFCSTLTHADHIAILSNIDVDVQEVCTETRRVRQLKKTD